MSEKVDRYIEAWKKWLVAERAMSAARDAFLQAEGERNTLWANLAPLAADLTSEERTQVCDIQFDELRGDVGP